MVDKMEKVWNITDHPDTDVREQVLVLFGQTVLPGSYVKVPASRLKRAHKLKKDVAGKMAHVGNQPPADYLTAKNPVTLAMPDGHARARFEAATGASEEALAEMAAATEAAKLEAEEAAKPKVEAPKEELPLGLKEMPAEEVRETQVVESSDVGSVEDVLGSTPKRSPNGGKKRY